MHKQCLQVPAESLKRQYREVLAATTHSASTAFSEYLRIQQVFLSNECVLAAHHSLSL